MQVVTCYFKRFSLLPYYFFCKNYAAQVFLYRFCTGFFAKIEKNLPIFCNFFSLCINKLEEI